MKGAGHSNNFDFIRILAAMLVIYSHQHVVSAHPEHPPIPQQSWGGIAVIIFFSLSGYLVAQSWERDPHLFRFAAKRVLRIWPALIVATLLCAFVVGPLVTQLPLRDYFDQAGVYSYVANTIGLNIVDKIPGVFDANHFHGVNSSIWTIPLEIKCYTYLAIAGLLGFMRVRLFPLVLILGIGWWYFFIGYFFNGFLPEMPDAPRVVFIEFALAFAYGVAMNSLRDVWKTRRFLCSSAVLLAGIGFGLAQHHYVAVMVMLPFFVVVFGEMSTPFFRRFDLFGDLSYGMYIYAFMTQQTIAALTRNALPWWAALIVSTACTAILAFASCHLVEQPAMRLKRFIGRRKVPAMTVSRSGT